LLFTNAAERRHGLVSANGADRLGRQGESAAHEKLSGIGLVGIEGIDRGEQSSLAALVPNSLIEMGNQFGRETRV
jgi:hypothetical protein